jgi:threonine aldolase
MKALQDKGAVFYDWPAGPALKATMRDDETLIRLVTSFATTEADVDSFLSGL